MTRRMLNSTDSAPSVLRVQEMNEEERRLHVEKLGREIADWSADLNCRLA